MDYFTFGISQKRRNFGDELLMSVGELADMFLGVSTRFISNHKEVIYRKSFKY